MADMSQYPRNQYTGQSAPVDPLTEMFRNFGQAVGQLFKPPPKPKSPAGVDAVVTYPTWDAMVADGKKSGWWDTWVYPMLDPKSAQMKAPPDFTDAMLSQMRKALVPQQMMGRGIKSTFLSPAEDIRPTFLTGG